MEHCKKNRATISGIIFAWFGTMVLINQSVTAQTRPGYVERSLKRADSLYRYDAGQGIAEAKKVYEYSLKENSVIHQIKSLKVLTGYLWETQKNVEAAILAKRSISLAKKAGIDSLTGDGFAFLGIIKHSEKKYLEAITLYEQANFYYKKRNLLKRQGIIDLNIGFSEKALARFNLANLNYFKAVKIFQDLRDPDDLANAFYFIGNCYSALNDYPSAINYQKKALMIRKVLQDEPSLAQSYNSIGYEFKQDNKADSAIFYLSRSFAIRARLKDSSLLVLTLQNMGSAWKMKGELGKARRYIKRSLNIASKYRLREETARGNLDLAELDMANQNYGPALQAASRTEATAVALKLPDLLLNVYSLKAALFIQLGDSRKALLYTNKKDVIKDSIFTAKKNTTIAELEIRYQTSQKEEKISTLNITNDLQKKVLREQTVSIIILVITAVLMLILLVIAYHNFRLKNKANLRIQTLMQDLHHRVKNNLQILSGLFSMQINELHDEKTKNALRENESRLASMNLIHHKLYLDNTTTRIEMQEYLTKLLHCIRDMFDTGSEKGVSLHFEVDLLSVEADKAVAIGLIVNELATNSFKYAFSDHLPGEIFLSLRQESKSKILLTFRDNGRGILHQEQDKGFSFGLKLVNLMARQLNTTLITKNDSGLFYQMLISL